MVMIMGRIGMDGVSVYRVNVSVEESGYMSGYTSVYERFILVWFRDG